MKMEMYAVVGEKEMIGEVVFKDGLKIKEPSCLLNPENWEKVLVNGKEINIEKIKNVQYDGAAVYVEIS